jgi:hypothetical protein
VTDSFHSKLPEYQATTSPEYPEFVIVMCSREDCPGKLAGRPFIVARKEWLRPRRLVNKRTGQKTVIYGRTCPYCSRSGRLPRSIEK